MNYRKKTSQADIETVIGDTRDCVSALRWIGHKTTAAIEWIAEFGGIAERRPRTFFNRDCTFAVTPDGRRHYALMIAAAFDRIADECERHADHCRDKASEIRYRESQQLAMQLVLPLGGNECGHGARRQAA